MTSTPPNEPSLAALILRPLLLPLLLLLAVAVVVFYGVSLNARNAAFIASSQARLSYLRLLNNDISNMENSQRGYVITAQDAFKQTYHQSQRDFKKHLGEYHRIMITQSQKDKLARVEQEVQQWQTFSAAQEMQARDLSLESAVALVKDGTAQKKTQLARDLLEEMSTFENTRLSEALNRNRTNLRLVRLLTLFGLTAGLVLLFLSVQRAIRKVSRSVRELSDSALHIAEGRYDARVRLLGVSELDELGGHFNDMAQAVQERQRALESSSQALRLSNESLERSNRELERFAYVASHDLQEPLRTIGSYTELLQKRYRGQLDERADKYIDFTISATHRLKGLIQDLLAFSRVHRPGRTFTQVDTSELVRQVREELEAKITRAGAEVRIEPLPEVRGNTELLHHVFLNLLTNAVKFRSAERSSQVRLWAERGTKEWVFHVQDNGIGIDSQYHEKIFGVFQRLHGVGEYEGSGIGLAVTRSAIEQHGGRLWLQSEVGKGSIFQFTLPDSPPDPTPTLENSPIS